MEAGGPMGMPQIFSPAVRSQAQANGIALAHITDSMAAGKEKMHKT